MAIRYFALYSDLLRDLQDHLPIDAVDEESVAKIEPWPGMTLKQFQSLQLAKTFYKKLEDRSTPAADQAALEKFLQSNIRCRDWSLVEDTPDGGLRSRIYTSAEEEAYGTFKRRLEKFYFTSGIDPLFTNLPDVFDRGRTGPGASLGASGNDFYTKMFSSKLTATHKGLYDAYAHCVLWNPNWAEAEKLRSAQYGGPVTVAGNRLSFAPKNRDISRPTCTEPSLNMFFQLGLGALLAKRLKQYFRIDLTDQPVLNKILAREGSQNEAYATVDLSSASDSVSSGMLSMVLPGQMKVWLDFVRSPYVQLPNGELEELHMISSMGNGYTFPLQTVLFSCAVAAVYDTLGIRLIKNRVTTVSGMKRKVPGNFGVYGDDIIVVKKAYPLLYRLLHILGFSVNADKSFVEGRFRESCGGDYFDGQPARGVYVKTLLTQASRYVAINRLNRWSAMTEIPLRRTIGRLVKTARWLPVPLHENDDAGIKTPFNMINQCGNAWLMRCPDTKSIGYKVWSAKPSTVKITESEVKPPKGSKRRIYNAPGLLEAFLRGDIEQSTLSIRFGNPRYFARKALTPNWDYVPTVVSEIDTIGSARLATAIRSNLPG